MFHFSCLPFAELTPFELYDIMALRQEVFVVEQICPYLDADGKDPLAWHLMVLDSENRLLAYTRLLPYDAIYPGYVSVGRVVSSPAARGMGAGKAAMVQSIKMCRRLFGDHPIKIGAQAYLLKFYEGFGFRSTGEEFLEDGIPHVKMILEVEQFSNLGE